MRLLTAPLATSSSSSSAAARLCACAAGAILQERLAHIEKVTSSSYARGILCAREVQPGGWCVFRASSSSSSSRRTRRELVYVKEDLCWIRGRF